MGPSCSSQDFAKLQNAAERPEVLPLEVADGASPSRLPLGIFAGLPPQPDQEGVGGWRSDDVIGAIAGWVRSVGRGMASSLSTVCLPRHNVWPVRSPLFDAGRRT
jgi:hypothetical protein